ncbi:MAG: M28 family peptidase [Caulobacteraceae bacterium]
MELTEKDMISHICNSVNFENMDELLRFFATFEKLSGTEGAELAVKYIMDKLKQYGIACEKYEFDGYLSNPVSSSLSVMDKEYEVESRPRSFSKNCPEGVTGEIVFDPYSTDDTARWKEKDEFYKNIRNKIVMSYGYDEGYAKKIEKYGAIGLVQIWPSEEDILHEDTVGTVWGTPTMDSEYFLLGIPVISIKNRDGSKLREMLTKERISVKLCSSVDTKVCRVSLPVAQIRGKSEEFVLLSGHYDTWYEGVVDNGTSNAACLETARILSENREKLQRSVRIAWWPGHSNGRYMGSTWYCDNFWDELYENCIAHINADCIGSKDTDIVVAKTTQLEGPDFIRNIVKDITGSYPDEYGSIGRGADQSFWGPGIPYHITARHEVSKGKRKYACAGSGVVWWHTQEDTYDKVDKDILVKDTKIFTVIAYELAALKVLPVDFGNYFDHVRSILEKADNNSDKEFDFKDIYQWLDKLKLKTEEVFERSNLTVDTRNKLVKLIGGEMNRLMHSYSGRYEHDYAVFRKLFPYISTVTGIYKDNAPEDEYLFIKTEFIRQRNRFVTDIKNVIREIDMILYTRSN